MSHFSVKLKLLRQKNIIPTIRHGGADVWGEAAGCINESERENNRKH